MCVLSRFSHVRFCGTLWTIAHQAPLCPWDSPGKNTGVVCHTLLTRIFLTQGSNPHFLCLLNWQEGSLPLVPPGKPFWVGTNWLPPDLGSGAYQYWGEVTQPLWASVSQSGEWSVWPHLPLCFLRLMEIKCPKHLEEKLHRVPLFSQC